ncbi:MAG TPA: GNAT family N-acetyltransferase [Pseudoneobacillus sp.]|nr:GNAT family N-acetyltransferase [Pseudoneobacillus sp.]
MKILYKELLLDDLHPSLLTNFNRYQETNMVLYKDNDKYRLKRDYFVEEWDDVKKREIVQSLQQCVQIGGIVIGAFHSEHLIGFANVEGEFFGTEKQYLELPYIHVSNEYRNFGIGKQLFQLCCEKAEQKGAKKLYIAAHPSEETQHFYRSVGCIYAEEINDEILAREPLDIQLERVL